MPEPDDNLFVFTTLQGSNSSSVGHDSTPVKLVLPDDTSTNFDFGDTLLDLHAAYEATPSTPALDLAPATVTGETSTPSPRPSYTQAAITGGTSIAPLRHSYTSPRYFMSAQQSLSPRNSSVSVPKTQMPQDPVSLETKSEKA